jgi:hypothetical protein
VRAAGYHPEANSWEVHALQGRSGFVVVQVMPGEVCALQVGSMLIVTNEKPGEVRAHQG